MFEHSFPLPPNVGSVRFSREVVRSALAEYDKDTVEAAAILTDELVTNAIMHGRPPIVLDIKEDHVDGHGGGQGHRLWHAARR